MKPSLGQARPDGEPLPVTPASSAIVAATAEAAPPVLEPARAFAQPLLAGRALDTGEDAWSHAEGVVAILRDLGAAPPLQAAGYLVYAADFLQQPLDTIERAFGPSHARLVDFTRRLVQVQRAARDAAVEDERRAQQTDRVRRMLLAFSRDLRVVLLRLASRLQTLRWYAATRRDCPRGLALESREVFAGLANRLGIWPIKWEMEDLAFRLLEPQAYFDIARRLDQTRAARELAVDFARHQMAGELRRAGVQAEVAGRPKHLYSIWKKMQGKHLAFEQVLDVRALRVLVADVPACYAALAAVHARYAQLPGEFDDYIARPKPNGYQSLHTVVRGDDGLPVEVQIRTQDMHAHAEFGVAAHWAYKEAGAKGYAGVSAAEDAARRVADARKAVMQQLLAWERDLSTAPGAAASADERIYVLTPQSTVVDLPAGATPVDFAYSLHTELGHRCRGARVDGALVPLNTALANGQTVEIVSAREGGPSLDWLNPELGYLRSPRAKSKVRAWFNAQAQVQTVARGREAIERLLQREGRTAVKHDDLAAQLGFKNAEALFAVVGKDEFSLRQVEAVLRPAEPAATEDPAMALRRSRAGDSGVLVVGVESLLTNLARCCRPTPPDAIGGFVTRDKGVAIHRADCTNFRHMASRSPERVIPVAWGAGDSGALYPVDLQVEAADRQGLLRDISEVLMRERVNVTGVHTQSRTQGTEKLAWMTFTVELESAPRVAAVLRALAQVPGVRHARRR